jgi:hypothetical protein
MKQYSHVTIYLIKQFCDIWLDIYYFFDTNNIFIRTAKENNFLQNPQYLMSNRIKNNAKMFRQKTFIQLLLILICGSLITISACFSSKKVATKHSLSNEYQVIFLDEIAAAEAITTDEAEGFFNKVTPLDMKIQMKNNTYTTEEIIKIDYIKHLKSSVKPVSENEEIAIRKVIHEVFLMCNTIAKDIFPKKIEIIKTNMNHYGASVFYTRENRIIIPENLLRRELDQEFSNSILKQIFHLHLRYDYWKRIDLYKAIGFESLDVLKVPTALKNRILLNPNGIAPTVIHHISDNSGEDFSAVPIIFTNDKQEIFRNLSFYSTVNFALYKIEHGQLITTIDGGSTVDMPSIANFYEQIGTNTTYIIHPNEILADNFVLLALWRNSKRTISELGVDHNGKLLLLSLEKILKQQ